MVTLHLLNYVFYSFAAVLANITPSPSDKKCVYYVGFHLHFIWFESDLRRYTVLAGLQCNCLEKRCV